MKTADQILYDVLSKDFAGRNMFPHEWDGMPLKKEILKAMEAYAKQFQSAAPSKLNSMTDSEFNFMKEVIIALASELDTRDGKPFTMYNYYDAANRLLRRHLNPEQLAKFDEETEFRYAIEKTGWSEHQGDPYPDTEADGVVFCGKCGKEKTI